MIIFLTYDIKIIKYHSSFLLFMPFYVAQTPFIERHLEFFLVARVTSLLLIRILTSFLTSPVSCLSPWAKQNFAAPLKNSTLQVRKEKTFEVIFVCILVQHSDTVLILFRHDFVNAAQTISCGIMPLESNFETIK